MASLSLLQIPPGVYVTVTGFIGTVMRTMTAQRKWKVPTAAQLQSGRLHGGSQQGGRGAEEEVDTCFFRGAIGG